MTAFEKLESVNSDCVEIHTLIIGSGFAGQCMAIRLQTAGKHDFLILERGNDVGGTWRDNQYPGAACDVPSHLYSLSFEQNANWSRKYPTQPELFEYLRNMARKHGLYDRTHFGCSVEAAEYDETQQIWRVTTTRGNYRCRVLVSGAGFLAEPKLPEIDGIESFAGKTFHSAQWDHDYEFAGKSVAVIGSGASAIQLVPEIAPAVGSLKVFQRTPNWIIPRPDRKIRDTEKFLLKNVKPLQWLYRWLIYWGHEVRVLGIVLFPIFMRLFQKLSAHHARKQVQDDELLAQVTPDYRIGCKRILISNDWYPALQRENVNLITEGIQEIREHSIVTRDGQEHEVDVLIFATGFYATDNPMAEKIRGRAGQSLAEAWLQGEEAYKGSVVHGFPNLFLLAGPNTGLGHSSMVFMIESNVEFVMRCLQGMETAGAGEFEVRAEVQREYNERLQRRMAGTVWATACNSWYKHASGKVTTLWPGFTFSFRRECRAFQPAEFLWQNPVSAAPRADERGCGMRRINFLLLFLGVFLASGCDRLSDDIYRNATQLERAVFGFERDQVDAEGVSISYYEGGDPQNPTLLLLHGFTADKDNWPRFARHLVDDYHVLIPDLAGHGDSEKNPDWHYSAPAQAKRVSVFVRTVGAKSVHVVGNSMGGFIAATFALNHPHQVRSLALFDAAGVASPKPSAMDERIARGDNPFFLSQPEEFESFWHFAMEDPPWMPSFILRHLGQQFVDHRDWHARMFADFHHQDLLGKRLHELRVPTLVLWGRQDRLLDVSMASVFSEGVANAQLVVLDGVGHLPMVERPGESAQIYRGFLQSQGQ